jgi:hypothetical protein
MEECRPDWSIEFRDWVISLVKMSMKCSVGVFEDNWYTQKTGVPTGGSLCVQLANIAVFSKLRKAVYSQPELMEKVTSVKRYIDDGAGFFTGSKEEFKTWLSTVNQSLAEYGLVIDESSIECPNTYVPFLDIQFCFSSSGQLLTDLYTKPTDSRSYLNFNSCHPPHVFSGIVFSQFLRLRRIINDNSRLKARIDELKVCFHNGGYPNVMVDNIANKVLGMERSLQRKSEVPMEDAGTPKTIRMISTFGSDSDLVQSAKQFESVLSRTRSFSLSDAFRSPTASPPVSRAASPVPTPLNSNSKTTGKRLTNKRRLFQFVKRTGASIRSRVNRVKNLALGKRFGKTRTCHSRNCGICDMISDQDQYRYNKTTVKTAEGSCASYNIIYLVVCSLCRKHYAGRSTRTLRTRIGEHRRYFYQIIDNKPFQLDNDDFALGSHLYHEHGCRDRSDFNKVYKISILEICSPKVIDMKEHLYIHRLNSLNPNGLNISNPLSIPVLYK